MELFQRVKQVSKELAGSETKLASMLGLPQRTLNGYLNEKSQRNLWEYLPKVLACFPQIRREWLWWDEGSMLKDSSANSESPDPSRVVSEPMPVANDLVAQLKHKNTELTEKLLSAKDELLEAKNELLEAKNEIITSKDKIIALHEENKRLAESVSAVVTPTEARRDNPQPATSAGPASGATECGV